MPANLEQLKSELDALFSGKLTSSSVALDELTLEVDNAHLLDVAKQLRDDENLKFEQLIDLCGIDYLDYDGGGKTAARFAVVYHLLSITLNQRIRLRVFVDDAFPVVSSVIAIWSCADWYEREAFDLYGIIFEGHPDLRRILTDYGFVGHPFRKDFPLSGHVEMRYDEVKKRVVYEPVSIDTRINTPRVIRDDHRYASEIIEGGE